MAKGGRPGGSFGGGRSGGSFSSKPSISSSNKSSSHNSFRHTGLNLGKAFLLASLLSRGRSSGTSNNPSYASTPFATQAAEKESYVYICEYCGSTFDTSVEKCTNCGAAKIKKVVNEKTQPKQQTTASASANTKPATAAKQKSKNLGVIIALIVMAVIITIIIIVSSTLTRTLEIGEWGKTKWFDFRVTSVNTQIAYNGKVAKGGSVFVLVGLNIINTSGEILEMYDNDFVLVKNNKPFYAELSPLEGNALNFPFYNAAFDYYYFLLQSQQEVSGLLVFEVPQGNYEMYLDYTEYDSNRNKGAIFKVILA